MDRRSILASALGEEAERLEEQPVAIANVRRRTPNAGKYHLGGYFALDDPAAEAFRMLAAKTRRSHQELLAEAIADLVEKYGAAAEFSR
jgi:hypothetical protein